MPSKKILLLFIACAGAVGLIFFAVYKSSPATYKNPDINSVQAILVDKALSTSNNTDTDRDDLKDWEETLWKTDPQNPDTDGDGVSDSEEVLAGRDPLVKGAGTKQVSSEQTVTPTENLTETEKFSRAFFEEYLLLKQSGQPIDDRTKQLIIANAISKIQIPVSTTIYGRADFTVTKKDDEATLKQYGNAVAKTLNKPAPVDNDGEYQIVVRSAFNEDPKELEKLAPIIEAYTATVAELKKVTVPESALINHIELINSTQALLVNIKLMSLIHTDPITGLGAVQEYPTIGTRFSNALKNLTVYFRQKNITFQQGEDGYAFTRAI